MKALQTIFKNRFFLFSGLLLAGIITFLLLNRHTGDLPIKISKEKGKAATDAAGAAEFELRMTRDPKTGKIPEGVRAMELAQARDIFARQTMAGRLTAGTSYSFQGPDNLGGRTRAIAYDVRYDGTTNQVILAGGVSGGLYKSTDNGATWVRKSPTSELYSVTSIAQDPRVGFQDTWYYASGEALGNSASETGSFYLGNGIYKSTDNGETWSRLTNSNTSSLEGFNSVRDLISKVIVNPVNGDVYIACIATISRSQDGGATWSNVLFGAAADASQLTDIDVTSTGRLYAAFAGTNANTHDGVWTSTTGDSGDWTRIAGTGAATNPAGWNGQNAYGRVVLAIAPGSENLVYALYWNGITSDCTPGQVEAELFRWDQTGGSWTDLSTNLPNESGCSVGNDPFAVQGGYDLVVAVKPDDANVVFIGGTNLYRSSDAFATSGNVTRIGGYANASGYSQYTNSHADIHAIAFQPTDPTIMLCGNDGGIQRTLDNEAGTVAWTPINDGYSTFQYYYVTIDPRDANTKVIGGAQDNGTTRNAGGAGTGFEQVLSGDGGSVGLSDLTGGNTYEYCSSQLGDIYRRDATLGANFGTDIRPSTAANDGLFITLFRLDPDNTELIYYANDSSLYRNTAASTATTANWTNMTGVGSTAGAGSGVFITALANTRGTYNASTASLFIGTEDGRVLRLDDPQNVAAATAPVDITNGALPAGYISSIAVNPRNDDTVLVTFSNYGVVNIWWTGNANSATPTWVNVEDNLTLPSVRSSAIAVTSAGVEYFVGTSVGLYTATIDAGSPANTDWAQEGASEIGNAVVSSLALRTSDNMLLAGTHGYGMWRTQLTLANLPVTFKSFSGKTFASHNELFWEVADEQNNKGFELERKYPGETAFSAVGFVQGRNQSGTQRYSLNDNLIDLGKETVFYRLKQVDFDGKITWSPELALNRRVSAKMLEYMSVNGNALLIRINNGNSNLNLQVRVFDMSGKLVQNIQTQFRTQQVDISRLARGTYVVELTGPNQQRVSQKIFKAG